MSREVLERPFPPELVRHRPGRNGESLAYVEGHVIVARLNEALEALNARAERGARASLTALGGEDGR